MFGILCGVFCVPASKRPHTVVTLNPEIPISLKPQTQPLNPKPQIQTLLDT